MKHWIIKGLILTGCMCMLSACGNSTGKGDTTADDWTESTASGVIVDINQMQEMKLNLTDYNLDYNLQTDMPSGFLWNHYATDGNGCYYFAGNRDEYIKYYDYATETSMFLCGNPQCLHSSEDCDSYIGFPNVIIQGNMLQYYDGYLYMLGNVIEDGIEKIYLFRMSKDGSVKERYMELLRTDADIEYGEDGMITTEYTAFAACIHRGYIYYNVINESPLKIRRMKLGDNTSETIFTVDGERGALYRMKAFGDYLFFQSGNFIDEKQIDIVAGVYAYNTVTGEVTFVKKDAVSSYYVYGNELYYTTQDGQIRVFSLETQEDRGLTQDSKRVDCYVDDKYVYSFKYALKVYDHDGNIIYTIENEQINQVMFGGPDIIVADDYSIPYFLRVDDIADGTAFWKRE